MSYAEAKINAYANSVDDEFQLDQLHKATVVAMTYSVWAAYISAAILAWVLPGLYSYLAILVLIPPMVGELVGQKWMTHNNPRARHLQLSQGEWAFMIIMLAIILAGLIYNVFGNSIAGASGTIIGGLLGGTLTAIFLPRMQAKARRKDQARLDAALEVDQ